MHWVRSGEMLKWHSKTTVRNTELLAAFADQRESLHWIALMITGDEELAEQSVVDATKLSDDKSYGFRAWLARWAKLATARASVNAVRSSIRATGERYADWTCSHRKHDPLKPSEAQNISELDAHAVIQMLDVLPRAVLVLHGCQHMSLAECADFLNVPLRYVAGAYCKAVQWCREFGQLPAETRQSGFSLLRHVRHDGEPVLAR